MRQEHSALYMVLIIVIIAGVGFLWFLSLTNKEPEVLVTKSHTIDGVRLDVIKQVTVDGEYFPSPDPDMISENFVMDVYDEQGNPIDLYPNQTPHPHPGEENRLTIRWVGEKEAPVFAPFIPGTDGQLTSEEAKIRAQQGEKVEYRQTGTRRGADFRNRFWPSVLRRIAQAQEAARLGKSIGELTDEELANAPTDTLERLTFTNVDVPIDLTSQDLEGANEAISGVKAETGTVIPSGTITNIDTNFSGYASSENDTDTPTMFIGFSFGTGIEDRGFARFSLTSIPDTDTINDVDLQAYVDSFLSAGEEIAVSLYNGTGDDDPSGNSASQRFARSTDTSMGIIPATCCGPQTIGLDAAVATAISGNLSSPDRITFGYTESNFDANETAIIDGFGQSDPTTLTIDHTEPAPTPTNTPTSTFTPTPTPTNTPTPTPTPTSTPTNTPTSTVIPEVRIRDGVIRGGTRLR